MSLYFHTYSINTYMHIHTYIYVHTDIYTHTYMCVHIHACMHTHIFLIWLPAGKTLGFFLLFDCCKQFYEERRHPYLNSLPIPVCSALLGPIAPLRFPLPSQASWSLLGTSMNVSLIDNTHKLIKNIWTLFEISFARLIAWFFNVNPVNYGFMLHC